MTLELANQHRNVDVGKLSLRTWAWAAGGFSRTRTRDPCVPQWALQSSGWGEAELVFQGPRQVDWRNKILFLGLLLCPRSQAVYWAGWLSTALTSLNLSISRAGHEGQSDVHHSYLLVGNLVLLRFGLEEFLVVGLTLPNQRYNTGSCLSELTLLLPLGLFSRGEFFL